MKIDREKLNGPLKDFSSSFQLLCWLEDHRLVLILEFYFSFFSFFFFIFTFHLSFFLYLELQGISEWICDEEVQVWRHQGRSGVWSPARSQILARTRTPKHRQGQRQPPDLAGLLACSLFFFIVPLQLREVFAHKGNVSLILEYLETDLERLIKDNTLRFSPGDVKSWMVMALRAVDFCHVNFLLHRVRSFSFTFRFFCLFLFFNSRTKKPGYQAHQHADWQGWDLEACRFRVC